MTGSESLGNAEVLVDDDTNGRPVAGIPQFAGSWPETEVARVGTIGLAALRLGAAHGLPAAAGAAGSFGLEELIRELGLPGEGDPAHDIAEGTYIDAYTRAAYPDIPPPPDWQQHGRYLPGQQIVTPDGRRGRLNGRVSRRSGDPRILFDGTAAAVTVPRREVAGQEPPRRDARITWQASMAIVEASMEGRHSWLGEILPGPGGTRGPRDPLTPEVAAELARRVDEAISGRGIELDVFVRRGGSLKIVPARLPEDGEALALQLARIANSLRAAGLSAWWTDSGITAGPDHRLQYRPLIRPASSWPAVSGTIR